MVDHHQQEEAQVTVLPPLQVLTNTDEQLAQSLTEFAEGSLDAEPKRKLSGDLSSQNDPNGKSSRKRKRKQKIEIDPITDFDDIPEPVLPPVDCATEQYFAKVYNNYTFTFAWLIKLCGEGFPDYQYILRKEVNQSLSAGNRNGFTINFVWKAVHRLMREHGSKSPLTFWDVGTQKPIFVSNLKQICPSAIALTSIGRQLVEPIINLEKTKKTYRQMARRNPDDSRKIIQSLEVIAPVTNGQQLNLPVVSQHVNGYVTIQEFRLLQHQVEELKNVVALLMTSPYPDPKMLSIDLLRNGST